jgi:hypothetical protein
VLEVEFILLEFLSPSRRIFIGSHSLPSLRFAISVLQWPQHVDMYRKRKRTETNTLVGMEKIKEQIKQELVAEMRMQNMQMQRWCCHQIVLSPMSNRASPSPATLKSNCASSDVGLIDGTTELVTEVRCDDRTHEDLIGMLTEPTHSGLWMTWRGASM